MEKQEKTSIEDEDWEYIFWWFARVYKWDASIVKKLTLQQMLMYADEEKKKKPPKTSDGSPTIPMTYEQYMAFKAARENKEKKDGV